MQQGRAPQGATELKNEDLIEMEKPLHTVEAYEAFKQRLILQSRAASPIWLLSKV